MIMTDDGASDDLADGSDGVPVYLSPYEFWNFGIGQGYSFPAIRDHAKYITALAEFPKAANINAISNLRGDRRIAWFPTLWNAAKLSFVPFVVENPLDDVKGPKALRNLLSRGLMQLNTEFAIDANFATIEEARTRVAFPVPERAMHPGQGRYPERPDWRPDDGLRGRISGQKRITIIAVIDDGLPFAHRNFRDLGGTRTRVEFCWLQSAIANPQQDSVLFGREYMRSQIEDYIAQYGDDEDTLYRKAGAAVDTEALGSLIDRRATHGAHVMDLAAGCASERGDDPSEEIRIIGVQLPNTVAWDTSGFGKDMYMLSAFHYIFDRADVIARGYGIDKPRLVINFSYGFSGGRHDGGTELEAAIDEMVALRRHSTGPTALVVPSGNSFLDRLHAVVSEADFDRGQARLNWRIQPNDRTPSYLELWFARNLEPSGYTIKLIDPLDRSRVSLPVQFNQMKTGGDPRSHKPLLNAEGRPVGLISADLHRGQRWRVLVILAPTEPEMASLPAIESGQWTVVISRDENTAPLEQPIQCWIQRAADPEGLRSGSRQSYFDQPANTRYTPEGDLSETDATGSMVRRFGSLNGLATGRTSLIVGGYRLGAGLGSSLKGVRPAAYSSAGALESGWPEARVACSSMSDRSRVLTGTIAAGVRSGARSRLDGTSTAAPFVARQLTAAFVTAGDECVEKAALENYRSLLHGYWEDHGADDNESAVLRKARLGFVRVPPHWQPGFDNSNDDRIG
ncbi:hypothetical protein C7U89_14880 [Bradyrhizobium sp. WBOS4]|nr:hypothetical protein [Bradyrhizobium sp. WBOS8]MDD1584210.1 hypothetical protein [Bradyrhizobium sp. WBOS4]UUO50533.1 hypothetical protein DCM78_28680 [Bradyrhizobium sp. WBOS04]UUO57911.1 hypothetical protein DCM80_01180 [Bradyrhizobium sp. WBOS08]